jgi:50S ribosomal subunit-associated GTPase HflX
LDEIGVQDLPIITAWNKIDACPSPAAVRALAASRPDVVAVSGVTGEGLEELLELVAQRLADNMVDMQVGWCGGTAYCCCVSSSLGDLKRRFRDVTGKGGCAG